MKSSVEGMKMPDMGSDRSLGSTSGESTHSVQRKKVGFLNGRKTEALRGRRRTSSERNTLKETRERFPTSPHLHRSATSRSPLSQSSLQETVYNSKLVRESIRIIEKALGKDRDEEVTISRQEALVCHRALITILDPQIDDVKHRVHALPDDVKQYLLHEFAELSAFRRLESAHSMRSIISSNGESSVKSSPSFTSHHKSRLSNVSRSFANIQSTVHENSFFSQSLALDDDIKGFSTSDMDLLENSIMAEKVILSDEDEISADDEERSPTLPAIVSSSFDVEHFQRPELPPRSSSMPTLHGSDGEEEGGSEDVVRVQDLDEDLTDISTDNESDTESVSGSEKHAFVQSKQERNCASQEGKEPEQSCIDKDSTHHTSEDGNGSCQMSLEKDAGQQSEDNTSSAVLNNASAIYSTEESLNVEVCEDDRDEIKSDASSVSSKDANDSVPLLHKRSGSLTPMSFFQLDRTIRMVILQDETSEEDSRDGCSTYSQHSPLHRELLKTQALASSSDKASLEEANEKQVNSETDDSTVHLVSTHDLEDASEIIAILRRLDEWDAIDPFHLNTICKSGPILVVGFAVFERHGVFDRLGVPVRQMNAFLEALQSRYLDNPYHNATHGADVGQTMSHMFIRCGLDKYASDLTRYAALFAAFCHDVGHLGVTNAFLVQTWHPLALRYNDRSPLEMMHASIAFELLRDENLNVTSPLNADEKIIFRKSVISMILATDNAEHDALLGRLTKVSQSLINSNSNLVSDLDQLNILEAALHAADISSSCKVWNIYKQWTDRLCVEFRNQGDLEKERGLPVLPFMDRTIKIPIYRFQSAFIQAIVEPLYTALNQVADLNVEHCISQLHENLRRWKEIQVEEEKGDQFHQTILRSRGVRRAKKIILSQRAGSSPTSANTNSPLTSEARDQQDSQQNIGPRSASLHDM